MENTPNAADGAATAASALSPEIADEIRDAIRTVLEKEKVDGRDEADIVLDDKLEKGDGFLGVMKSVWVLLPDGRRLDYIVKTSPRNATLRAAMPVDEIYAREAYAYERVLRRVDEFQRARPAAGARPFASAARCVHACTRDGRELLAFENLVAQGYRMWDCRRPQPAAHMRLVFDTYARWHAASLAMRDQCEHLWRDLTARHCWDLFAEMSCNDDTAALFERQAASVRGFLLADGGFDADAVARFDRFAATQVEWQRLAAVRPDRNSVLLHGDSWNNNMMFKYDDPAQPDEPTSIRLYDFQLLRVGPPAADLVYYFYTCAGDALTLANWQTLLRGYHAALADQLAALGSPRDLLPYAELERQWREQARLGLGIAMFLIGMVLKPREERPDFTREGVDIATALPTADGDEYRARITLLVRHFVDEGFLQ